MVIRSQNKLAIINWNNIKGFRIVEGMSDDGSCRIVTVDNDLHLIFAIYDSKDRAELVLRELFDDVRNNKSFYQFPGK